MVLWFSVGNEQFAKFPDAGVPKAGVVRVGDERVKPAIVAAVAPSATAVLPMVTVLLARLALVMPAVPDRLALVMPLRVPPSVRFPVVVTEPERESPLTVPVPPTDVTVPDPPEAG